MPASFAVVTPNLNMGRYLARTIESVLCNLQPGDQYFVVDGGSTDESITVIKRYAAHLTGWISEPDRGYADAIAKGFRLAQGDLMCWVNSSDMLLCGALKFVRDEFQRRDVDLLFGDDYCIDEYDRVEFRSIAKVSDLKRWMLYGGWTPLQDACFWRRSAYQGIEGIDASFAYAADYDFFLRLVVTSKYAYLPKALSAYRRHEGQKGVSGMVHYQRERLMAQQRAVGRIKTNTIAHSAMGFLYGNLARIRARVLASLYRDYSRRGRSIRDVQLMPSELACKD